MQANTTLHTKNNILLIASDNLVLQKTRSKKIQLIIADAVSLGVLAFLIFLVIQESQAHPLKIPKDFLGRTATIAVLFVFLYFPFLTVKSSIIDYKNYIIRLDASTIMVNDKPLGNRSAVRVKIFEEIGWRGLGKSYKICLARKGKRKTLSSGNELTEAENIALQLSKFLGIELQKMWLK